MKHPLLILFLPFALALASCQSGGAGNTRYEYPPSRLATPKEVEAASIDGRFVILKDGSMWNVDWRDAQKARRWSAGDRINVISTQGNSFPYALIKQGSGERIAVRYGKKL